MNQKTKKANPKLGEILLEHRLITTRQLEEGLLEQKSSRKRLGTILIQKGWVSEEDINFILSQQLDVPYVHLTTDMIDESLVKSIPREILERYVILPLIRLNNHLNVVMADPTDHEAIDDLASITNCVIQPALGRSSVIRSLLEFVFGPSHIQPSISSTSVSDFAYPGSMDFLKNHLQQAILLNASELHFEPLDDEIRIRYRVDDQLFQKGTFSKITYPSFISRLKILFKFDMAKPQIPQKGMTTFSLEKETIRLEAIILPTFRGESVTLRIGRVISTAVPLNQLISETSLKKIDPILTKTSGVLVITGSPDILRTQIVYGLLDKIDKTNHKVITIENSLSIPKDDYIQLSIASTPGMQIETAFLNAIDQGGDILVLEMEDSSDLPTLVFQSSVRGKLILGTTGYRDSEEVLAWLRSCGVKSFFVSSYLHGIVAITQFKKLCPFCKVASVPEKNVNTGKKSQKSAKTYYRSNGCEKCNHRGYIGYVNLSEVFRVTPTIKKSLGSDGDISKIIQLAEKEGFVSIRDQASEKVSQGIIGINEFNQKFGDLEM